jgi:hypothetical protein
MKRIAGIAGVLAIWLAGPLIFLLREGSRGLSGFPLDDAWIHQTYARALAGGLGWSYAGGPPSAGSTSPAWTLLQVPSHWLGVSPVVWSSGLGLLLLMANAIGIYFWIRTIHAKAALYAMVFVLGEWHLVWAGLSGMETLLFAAWISAVVGVFFVCLTDKPIRPLPLLIFGMFIGAGLWIRPEAILFSALAFLSFFKLAGRRQLRQAMSLGLGIVIGSSSYFLFQFQLHGMPWPNTYYAKPAEYLPLSGQSLLVRLFQPWIPLLAGPLGVLWIFIIPCAYFLARRKTWLQFWPLTGCILHIAVFSIRLPAVYQHGRYFVPLLPILLGYGVCGCFLLKERIQTILLPRILTRAGWTSAVLLLGIFIWIGAGRFVEDVDLIESEMVFASRWINAHTPEQAVIAAHDIGALGFWGRRRIVDLGGLTDLGALELLKGEISLNDYLRRRQVDYLMAFPVFYPDALRNCLPIMLTGGLSQLNSPETMMSVYDWNGGCSPASSR